jgi:hypothetical protein
MLLAAEVAMVGDAGGKAPQWGKSISGMENVARVLASTIPWFVRIGGTIDRHELNGQPGATFRDRDNKVVNTVVIDVLDGRIQTVRSVLNPDTLGHVARWQTAGPSSARRTRLAGYPRPDDTPLSMSSAAQNERVGHVI